MRGSGSRFDPRHAHPAQKAGAPTSDEIAASLEVRALADYQLIARSPRNVLDVAPNPAAHDPNGTKHVLAAPEHARGTDGVMLVTLSERWLQASFREPVRACSWAIVGGGFVDVDHVAWCEVRDIDLRPPVDARRYLLDRIEARKLGRVVGLLTSRRVASYSDARAEEHGLHARCIATVGLGNALRAGDPSGIAGRIGTINLLVHLDVPLTDEALLEASSIATEAKAAVVLDAGVRSRRTGRGATGTGTDCTVVACRADSTEGRGSSPLPYAGKHTTAGSLVGAVVESAVAQGVARWLAENAT